MKSINVSIIDDNFDVGYKGSAGAGESFEMHFPDGIDLGERGVLRGVRVVPIVEPREPTMGQLGATVNQCSAPEPLQGESLRRRPPKFLISIRAAQDPAYEHSDLFVADLSGDAMECGTLAFVSDSASSTIGLAMQWLTDNHRLDGLVSIEIRRRSP